MAVKSSSNWYSNAIVGTPAIGADVNVHDVHTSPKYAIGIGFERQDGARFRYVQYGADCEAGQLVSSDLSESGLAVTGTNVIIQSASATAVAGEAVLPGAKGSHYVEAYLTASLNQFAGGYLNISAVGAAREGKAGYTYRIRGNTSAASGGGQKCLLNLYEPLKYELGTETCFSITGNPWVNVEAANSTDPFIAGVSMAAASSNQYGWVCSRGIATVNTLGTGAYDLPLVGEMLGVATGNNGAVAAIFVQTGGNVNGLVNTPFVGIAVHTGSNGTYTSVALNIM